MDRRPVPGYPDWEADEDGKVYRNGIEVAGKPCPYISVYVPGMGMIKRSYLVAFTFHGEKPFHRAVLRHLNDIKTDDRPSNLKWGTQSENMKDLIRNDRRQSYLLTDFKEPIFRCLS